MSAFDSRALGQLAGATLPVVAYRNQAKGFDPRSGDGARRLGGRFNPSHSFPVLYLCLTRRCVDAELTRQAERQSLSVEDLLPRELFEISAHLDKVLDLIDPGTLDALGSLHRTSYEWAINRTTATHRAPMYGPTSTAASTPPRR